MKKYILFLLFSLTLIYLGFGQPNRGQIIGYSPSYPSINDTFSVKISTNMPSYSASGSTCGILYSLTDTIINNELQLTAFFDFCYTGTPPYNCFRDDTIKHLINRAGISSAKIIWNIKSTVCAPLTGRLLDSALITFGATGMEELKSTKNFTASPNPVSNMLRITTESATKVTRLEIWSANGQLVKDLDQEVSEIDVSDLPSGIYFLKIGAKEATEVLRVVKQ